MDRLLLIQPKELVLKFEIGEKSRGFVQLENVMHTMPVAFQVLPTPARRYTVKPAHGIISPLGTVTFEITLNPPSELPDFFPQSQDKFLVNSVVVPGGSQHETVSLDWFTANKKQVYSDHCLRVIFVGGQILRRLVQNGSMEEIRDVLERDEKLVDSPGEQGRTAMHIAVATGRPELVQLLLEFKADPEIKSAIGQTALQDASAGGQALIVELLLAKGARTDSRNLSGWTALHHAVRGRHMEVLHLLLEKGADVDAAIHDRRTALHMAVAEGQHECLRLLLSRGANANLKTSDGESALHMAASRRDLASVKLLINYGANPDIRNREGKTPFDYAVQSRNGQLLDMLRLGDGLRWAARKGQVKVVRQYLEAGASVHGRDQHGWTALHRAAFKGYSEVVRLLLEKGAEMDCKDEEGYTALHCAIEAGHKDVAQMLLKNGANVDAQSNRGFTALHIAVSLNRGGIIRLLMECGACRDIEGVDGRTAFDMMQERGYQIMSPPLQAPSSKHLHTDYRRMAFV